jgi:hypothetical protein
LLRCEHRDLAQPDVRARARAAELQHRIDETPDEANAPPRLMSLARCSTTWRTSRSCRAPSYGVWED